MDKQKQKEMYDLWMKSYTLNQIARIHKLHRKTVSKYLKQMGVVITNRGNTGNKKPIKMLNYSNNQERDDLVISEYRKGVGSPTIAKYLNIGKRTVLRILAKNNIKRTNSYLKPSPPKKEIKALYQKGFSTEKIAAQYDVSNHIIAKQLGNLRTPGKTMSSLHGIEDRVIKLYQEGLSTYDIADILGFSHAESIRRFIKNKGLTRSEKERKNLAAIKLSSQSHQSRPEKLTSKILNDLEIDFEAQFPLDGWNFDFKIGNLLLEIQSYWHLLPKRIQKDKKKAKIAQNHGYTTAYLWEHQLKNPKFVEEFLLYKLGIKKPINFDFCNVVIKKDRAASLELMRWHYHQKIGRYGYEYVAYLHGLPVATCVFTTIIRHQMAKKQKVDHTEILELTRFVIHPNYHKRNFGSWFMARCTKLLKSELPHLKKLISFSDTTYNHDGGIYRASNWSHDGEVPSDYWYVTPTRSIKHKKTVWNSAKRESLTESVYATKHKLQKVFGLPKHRFIKTL